MVTPQAMDIQRAGVKRQVRDVANGARSAASTLRRRMNALEARPGGAGQASAVDLPDAPPDPLGPEPVTTGGGDAGLEVTFDRQPLTVPDEIPPFAAAPSPAG